MPAYLSLVVLLAFLMVLYFIIRTAVKEGILDADAVRRQREQELLAEEVQDRGREEDTSSN